MKHSIAVLSRIKIGKKLRNLYRSTMQFSIIMRRNERSLRWPASCPCLGVGNPPNLLFRREKPDLLFAAGLRQTYYLPSSSYTHEFPGYRGGPSKPHIFAFCYPSISRRVSFLGSPVVAVAAGVQDQCQCPRNIEARGPAGDKQGLSATAQVAVRLFHVHLPYYMLIITVDMT